MDETATQDTTAGTTTSPEGATAPQAEEFAERVFGQLLAAMELLSIHLGDRLGLYRALLEGPATPSELAAHAGVHERYAREWLEQQAVAGILEVEGEGDAAAFRLPPAQAEVLTDPTSLAFSAPFARLFASAAAQLPLLLDAYRSGGGVPWARYGADARDGQGDVNRPWFEQALAEALAGVPEVHEVLTRPDAGVADIACGHGWSTIALARAYRDAIVEGFDLDAPAIASAREHAAGIENVSFSELRGEQLADQGEGRFDAAFIFEALHDMPDPVGVLAAIRRALRPDGILVVMDEAVAETFAAPGDEIERAMYGYSLLMCLPDSMSTPGSVATGTVMRPATLERYAREAGFTAVRVLPIEGFAAFRFYLLEP